MFFIETIFLSADLQPGYDEIMEEMEYDDPNLPFTCPFCSDAFDAGELCCHFYDDHLVELKTRVLFLKF